MVSILYYASIFLILIALVSFIYELISSQPHIVHGTLRDLDEDGIQIVPADTHEKPLKVHMAEGLRSELHPFTKDITGYFLVMNNYVLLANVGIINVKSRHDLSINSPYAASHAGYWVGMLGPMILWGIRKIGDGPNAIIEQSFLIPLIIFCFVCAGVWTVMHRLKAKIIVTRLTKHLNTFEQMRTEEIQRKPNLQKNI